MIRNIEIERLYPHPHNPRQQLGDLTELAESIRANGVLQNLTVVPLEPEHTGGGIAADGAYTVVIGHRRLAAAKMAGLKELPCAVSDMSIKEQIATMLLENMQRSDLTVLEQADGFQMMMDLGETVAGIADKTGFAETTVRHRLKLKELDRAKLEEASARGGRLEDFIELEKIRDVKARNEMLEYIGTSNFNWKLKQVLDEQEKPERKKAMIEKLNEFATPINSEAARDLFGVEWWWGFRGKVKRPEDIGEVGYFYVVSDNYIALYRDKPKAEQTAEPKEMSEEEKSFKEREAAIEEMAKRAYELRYAFVKNFTAAKKYAAEIQRMAFRRLLSEYGCGTDYDTAMELLGIPLQNDENENDACRSMLQMYEEQPEKVMLVAAYASFRDKEYMAYFIRNYKDHVIKHYENVELNELYDGLVSLGYEMSDEEKALRDGTHELFDRAGEDAEEDEGYEEGEYGDGDEGVEEDDGEA